MSLQHWGGRIDKCVKDTFAASYPCILNMFMLLTPSSVKTTACCAWSLFLVEYLTLVLQVIHVLESSNTKRSSMFSAPKKLLWNSPPAVMTSLQRWQRKPNSLLNSFVSSDSTNSFPASVLPLRSAASFMLSILEAQSFSTRSLSCRKLKTKLHNRVIYESFNLRDFNMCCVGYCHSHLYFHFS